MKDFVCHKIKSAKQSYRLGQTSQRSKRSVKASRLSSSASKQQNPSYFKQVLGCVCNRLMMFFGCLGIFLLVLYFGFNYLFDLAFPIESNQQILLIFKQNPQLPSNYYFFSLDADNQRFGLSQLSLSELADFQTLIDANLAKNQHSPLELLWSARLGILVDRVEEYLLPADTSGCVASVAGLRRLFLQLAKQELLNSDLALSARWQRVKKLLQWRLALADYRAQGRLALDQPIDVSQLSATTLSWDNSCSLGVLNATKQSGLAGLVSAVLERAGLLVLRISNADLNGLALTNSQLVFKKVPSADCNLVLSRLNNFLPVNKQTIYDEQLLNQYRSDIILILGEDMADIQLTSE